MRSWKVLAPNRVVVIEPDMATTASMIAGIRRSLHYASAAKDVIIAVENERREHDIHPSRQCPHHPRAAAHNYPPRAG